ncbi:MAG TPA: PEP-CTERM sorting domain-containing protein [Verrucomicrobiae bacterium]|nr:PEP-CTERM sorting domain-containing protein [Verrucomicrobiae bacterium]
MKARFFLPIAVSVLFAICTVSVHSQTVITFDDLSDSTSGTFIANGYQGLNWTNFFHLNAIFHSKDTVVSGYNYGMVSASNVAFNGRGNPAEIDSQSSNFNFLCAYLTGAWNSNLNIEVEGFSATTLLYDTTVVASATSPTLYAFNYLDIDRLTFNSFSGQNAGFGEFGEQFAMDNFTFEFVPEPSTLLLAGFGTLTLWPLLKRRRA